MDSATMNAIASQGQVLVSIDAWGTEYWAEMSGGDVSADTTDVFDGGALDPEQIPGRPTTSDLTIKKPYRPGTDKRRLEAWLKRVGALTATITVSDTDADLVGGVYGKPRVFTGRLKSIKGTDFKAGKADPQTIETVWAGRWI